MSGPVEIAAEALHERHYNDLSSCPYYQGEEGGTCSFGCSDEPQCKTGHPGDGWPSERLRERYASLLPAEDADGWEPTEDDILDALMVLEALHAAGWRIVQTSTCGCGQPDVVHGDGVKYPEAERIVAEWTPEAPR